MILRRLFQLWIFQGPSVDNIFDFNQYRSQHFCSRSFWLQNDMRHTLNRSNHSLSFVTNMLGARWNEFPLYLCWTGWHIWSANFDFLHILAFKANRTSCSADLKLVPLSMNTSSDVPLWFEKFWKHILAEIVLSDDDTWHACKYSILTFFMMQMLDSVVEVVPFLILFIYYLFSCTCRYYFT